MPKYPKIKFLVISNFTFFRLHDVSRLILDDVLGELGYRGCALDGPDAALRDRLLRAVLREKELENRDIPWYRWDDAVVIADEREPELEEDEPRDEIEVEQGAGRGDGALGARREGLFLRTARDSGRT